MADLAPLNREAIAQVDRNNLMADVLAIPEHLRDAVATRGRGDAWLRKPFVHVSRFPVVMVAVDTMHPDDARQPALLIGFHVPNIGQADAYVLEVIAAVLFRVAARGAPRRPLPPRGDALRLQRTAIEAPAGE